MANNSHSGHRERLRQRALNTQLEQMPAHEVMELLLTYIIPVRDVNQLAHDIIDRFGTVRSALRASAEELMEVPGVGRSTADFLALVGKALDEYVGGEEKRPAYTTARKLAKLLGAVALQPGYYVACMDAQKRLLHLKPLPSEDARPEDMARDVISIAIRNHSYNVVVLRKGGAGFDRRDYGLLPALLNMAQGLEIHYLDELMQCDSGELKSLKAEQKEEAGATLRDEGFLIWLEDWGLKGPRDPYGT